MVKRLFKTGRKGYRVSSSGILFKEVKGKKQFGERIFDAERKYGAKNVEATKIKGRGKVFRRIKKL